MRRRWPILALLVWLPLVKWVLPPGDFRWALFYGGGTVLAAYAIRRAGDWPRLRALFAQPWRGMADGLTVYLTLMVQGIENPTNVVGGGQAEQFYGAGIRVDRNLRHLSGCVVPMGSSWCSGARISG